MFKYVKIITLIFVIMLTDQLDLVQNRETNETLEEFITLGSTNNNDLVEMEDNKQLSSPEQNTSLLTIYNILVLSYADVNKYIRLNISWNINDEDKTLENLHLAISNMDKCRYSFVYPDYPLNKKFIVIPNLAHKYPADEIQPGCTYNITLQTSNQEITTVYEVPDCVNETCDCNKHKPEAKLLNIQQINEDEFLVKWDPGSRTAFNKNYTIQDIHFYYTYRNSSFQRFVITDCKNDLKNNYSKIKLHKIIKEEDYILIAEFITNYDCNVFTTLDFSVHHNPAFLIYFICLLLFLLLLWKYKLIIMFVKRLINLFRIRFNTFVPTEANITLATINENGNMIVPMQTNLQYISTEIYNKPIDKYEFLPTHLMIIKEIGRGAFGQVYLGKAFGIAGVEGYSMVAIKTLGEHPTSDELDDFISEIEIFKKIGVHPNIVTLLGCCTLNVPYMMIMEFVPCGNLQNYLINLRNQWSKKRHNKKFFPDNSDGGYIGLELETNRTLTVSSSEEPLSAETMSTDLDDPDSPLLTYQQTLNHILDPTELQNFAFQIAKGMAHLEQISITHRDLAARNILISEYKNLKISDFGLSRKGPYVNHKLKHLPLRWLAIEAILNHIYNSKTDVWSFGVVLWEIGTLGAFPYEQVPNSLLSHYLQIGNRLQRPEICTDDLYKLMLRCWSENPEDRPSFKDLVELLDVKKQKVYVDFSQLNPAYMFPPTELDSIPKDLSKLFSSNSRST